MQDVLLNWLRQSDNIVFFGGAGVSTESGIADFRSARGLYRRGRATSPEIILSHDFFYQHPAEFYQFYFEHMVYEAARPNTTHHLLAKLESMGKLRAVITQNIDGLHQMAGSECVLELHGSVHRHHCVDCQRHYDLAAVRDRLQTFQGVPRCSCGGLIKPNVVLYGEPLDADVVSCSIDYVTAADVLIIAGTSLVVYPAASMVDYYQGDRLVIINATATPRDKCANLLINRRLEQVIKPIYQRLVDKT